MHFRRATFIPLLLTIGCQEKKPDGPPSPVASATHPRAEPSAVSAASTPARPSALGGTIAGRRFQPQEVSVEAGKEGPTLMFNQRDGDQLTNLQVLLPVPGDEKMSGREWSFGGKVDDPVITISLAGQTMATSVFGPDYSMNLRLTNHTRDTVEGFIDLTVTKPADTRLKGDFRATYRKLPTLPLGPEDAPYVEGKIVVKGAKKVEKLGAGYVGVGIDGKPYSNESSYPVDIGEPLYVPVPNPEKASQLSWLASIGGGITYRHVTMPPGDYLVYVRRDAVMSAWKRVKLKDGDRETVDLTIDPAATGEVVVTLPDSAAKDPGETSLSLVPAKADLPELGLGGEHYFNVATVKMGEKTVKVSGIPAGKYRAVWGTDEAEIEVLAGKAVAVTLVPAKK
jgi:hypothetical protein